VTRCNGLAAIGNDREAAASVGKDAVALVGKIPAESVGEVVEVAKASSVRKDAEASVGKIPAERSAKSRRLQQFVKTQRSQSEKLLSSRSAKSSIAEVAVASVFEGVTNIDRPYIRKTRR